MRLQQGFQDPRVMAVTGLVLPSELETETQFQFQVGSGGPGWKYQSLIFDELFFAEMRSRGVPAWRIGAGANMAFRRKAFDLLGLFDERLGAGASGCSEDSELWYRVLAAGWVCRYEPTAVVFHSHRADLDSLRQQMYQYLRGHGVALLVQFARYGHWGNLRRLFIAMPKYYSGLFLRGLRHGFRQPYSTVLAEIRGYFAGYGYYLRHREPFQPPEP
jgi:cellulose synthase/poly-beta-1,6-N-acetylglucosamine synthase-like glycosyltransferase